MSFFFGTRRSSMSSGGAGFTGGTPPVGGADSGALWFNFDTQSGLIMLAGF